MRPLTIQCERLLRAAVRGVVFSFGTGRRYELHALGKYRTLERRGLVVTALGGNRIFAPMAFPEERREHLMMTLAQTRSLAAHRGIAAFVVRREAVEAQAKRMARKISAMTRLLLPMGSDAPVVTSDWCEAMAHARRFIRGAPFRYVPLPRKSDVLLEEATDRLLIAWLAGRGLRPNLSLYRPQTSSNLRRLARWYRDCPPLDQATISLLDNPRYFPFTVSP